MIGLRKETSSRICKKERRREKTKRTAGERRARDSKGESQSSKQAHTTFPAKSKRERENTPYSVYAIPPHHWQLGKVASYLCCKI